MARLNESLDLRIFNVGLYSNPDQEDIPTEAQAEGSYRLDPNLRGKLGGVYTSSVVQTTYGVGGTKFGWIERNSGEWDLIYTDGTDTKVIYDFYGTPSHATLISGTAFETIISNNQEVHLGMGKSNTSKWIGYVSHGQFGASAPSGLQIENAEPTQPGGSHSIGSASATTTATEEDAVFPKGVEYQYKISFVYDGYQESPLGGVGTTHQVTDFYTQIALTLTIASYSTLNDRITGVKVYRRERPFYDSALWTTFGDWQRFLGDLNVTANEDFRYKTGALGSWGEYKLVDDIDINDSGWNPSGANKTYTVTDTNVVGATYAQNVGIQEENYYTSAYYGLDYGLATMVNNYAFVTNAKHQRLPDDDAAHMIFRSKPYRYDTFDWANDKLIMPTIPKAMKPHRGLLYVWDENNTYIIEPRSFQIIKTITGRGCASQESVVETDYGLYWANKNGVYWSTLTEELIQPTKDNLTEPIRLQYQTAFASATPWLTYNSKTGQLLVRDTNSTYAYHTVDKRWDYYLSETGNNTRTGTFCGKDGETYFATDNDSASEALHQDFASGTRASWVFISKEFTLDDPSQYKKFYSINVNETGGTSTVTYSLDGGSTYSSPNAEGVLPAARGKSIKIKIVGGSAITLESVSITYRRLRGRK